MVTNDSCPSHIVATAVAAAVWLGVLIIAILIARRRRSAIPVLFIVGGALTLGYEPIVDTLGKCYLPADHQLTLFTVLNRPMPLYAVLRPHSAVPTRAADAPLTAV